MGICHLPWWLEQIQCGSIVVEVMELAIVELVLAIVGELAAIVVGLVAIVVEVVASVEVMIVSIVEQLVLGCGEQRYHRLGSLGTLRGQLQLETGHRLERKVRQRKELRRSPVNSTCFSINSLFKFWFFFFMSTQ